MASRLDFALRLAFFALAPIAVVLAAALFPIAGALAQIALATGVFVLSEAVRRLSARSRLARLLLSNELEMEAFYRERPPRPFLYYVFYPLLFPYWLVVPDARREFLLFKGYTLASFALLCASLVAQYLWSFPPELRLLHFLPIAAWTFAVETVVVLAFLVPMATTVMQYHRARERRALAILLAVGALSVAGAVGWLLHLRDPVVSYVTRERVRLRTRVDHDGARAAQTEALRAAWSALREHPEDVAPDGKVEGQPLDRARQALTRFYRRDETFSFDLWRGGSPEILVLYFERRGRKAPLWLAMDAAGAAHHQRAGLPPGAFRAMKEAADGIE